MMLRKNLSSFVGNGHIMKLRLSYIALLVILSMIGVFAYQAYWLVGLYKTMHSDMERSIHEAIRISNYNEMLLRMQNYAQSQPAQHGMISVSAAIGNGGNMQMKSTTIINDTTINERVKQSSQWDTLNGSTVLRVDKNAPQNQQFLNSLTGFLQSNIHSGLDAIASPDLDAFAQFFTAELDRAGIPLSYRLELLQANMGNSVIPDTLGVYTTPNYEPSMDTKTFCYDLDSFSHRYYQITTEQLSPLIWGEMAGILATSGVILLILIGSFYYLIHTILKQKTLDEMKSDFTNNITHELKTPIAVAYAANDALLNFNQAEDKVQRDGYLHICQEQLTRLSGLVEQILSMSMEQRKNFRLQREEFLLNDVLITLVEQHKLKTTKPVNISIDIHPEGLKVFADYTHFTNILSNLIDNAIKYSHHQADVHISCCQLENGVSISIKDNGIGIAPEKKKYIFDKFYRVPTGNLHNVKGYGLGLYYVKTMVEKHGGSIEVKSELGKGSEFKITL